MILAISGPHFDFIGLPHQAQDTDPALVAMRDKIRSGTRIAPWSITDDMITYDSRLYIPPSSPLLTELDATVHEGVQRTLHHLWRDFHSPNFRRVVQDCIRACHTCLCYKSEHLHPASLLLPLPVPSAVWTDLGLDLVEDWRLFPRWRANQ